MDELEFIHAIKYISPYDAAKDLFAYVNICLIIS